MRKIYKKLIFSHFFDIFQEFLNFLFMFTNKQRFIFSINFYNTNKLLKTFTCKSK